MICCRAGGRYIWWNVSQTVEITFKPYVNYGYADIPLCPHGSNVLVIWSIFPVWDLTEYVLPMNNMMFIAMWTNQEVRGLQYKWNKTKMTKTCQVFLSVEFVKSILNTCVFLQGMFSMQVHLTDLLTMKLWPTARVRTHPWPPQETCMLPGSRVLICAVKAGFWTAAYVMPLINPSGCVAEERLEFTQFTCCPTKEAFLTWTPNSMLIALRVNIAFVVKSCMQWLLLHVNAQHSWLVHTICDTSALYPCHFFCV